MSLLASSKFSKKSDNLTIYIEQFININHEELKRNLSYTLSSMKAIPNLPSNGIAYIKQFGEKTNMLFYLNGNTGFKPNPEDNYVDGFNVNNLEDTKKYRFRGLFSIGFRYKKSDNYIAESFFLELVPPINNPDRYIRCTIYEEEQFNLDKEAEEKIHSEQLVDLFTIKFIFNFIRTMDSKKCYRVDISNINLLTANLFSSAIISINTTGYVDTLYETYIGLEYRDNILNLYVYEPIKNNNLGVEPMLNGKNKRVSQVEEKELPIRKVISIPLNRELKINCKTNFELCFVCRGEGYRSGSCFNLPFEIDNNTSHITGDRDFIESIFLYLRSMMLEKTYSFDTKVKWSSERITNEATINGDVLTYSGNGCYKTNDIKFSCKTHGMSSKEPEKVHLIKIKCILPLPEN